jgi:phospholipase/lecithinase/hemolysin
LSAAAKTYIRQRILDYNAGFVLKLNQARATLPGLTIYAPDTFSLLDDMVANPSHYGLVHPEIDALDDHSFTDKSLNGPGATYLFWDYSDPSAKGHMVLADVIQHLLSTVVLTKITVGGGNSQVYMSNIPVGRNGVVDGTADFLSWNADANFSSLSLSQSVSVPQSGRTLRFYRLRFPFLWTWP